MTPSTDPTTVPARTGALAPLGYRDFRLLWSATLVSNFGGLVQAVGAAWLMTQLTDSATLIALVQASNTLPIMLLAIGAGALADGFAALPGFRLGEAAQAAGQDHALEAAGDAQPHLGAAVQLGALGRVAADDGAGGGGRVVI